MTPIHPGKIVADRFEIRRVAGSGGMGVVYKAHDRQTDREVALKVLLERDAGPSDRFAHEVELLSVLEHPHIIGYVTHGIAENGAPFLVMPWLEGMDLEQRLQTGPLSIDDTLVLARAVADALAYLHGRGLVHRDLKPSNLFLQDGRVDAVKVVDLGVARASVPARALTQSGVLIGTPGFIAPEQARGDREIAPTVDIFALGCVLFECLTGRRLFSGAHLMSVLAKILLEDAPRVRELRPDAPGGLDLLVHRMVAKQPEKRPADGAALMQWLADLERLPLESRAPLNALTASERRVVTVLVVVLPSARGSIHPDQDLTRVEADPFGAASARFGVHAHLLAERTAIVLAPERVGSADQASVLARFARHVVETYPRATIALTTGSAVTGARLPVGEAIDRAVTMVRAGALGVEVDEVTAALIGARFDLRREGERLLVEEERQSLDPTRPLLGKPTSCVGRDRELAILQGTFAECAGGDGPKVVLVTAEAGAGKSRLRHELVRRLCAGAEPPRVLQCRGDLMHLATPYAMMAQTVRQAIDLRGREPAERVREKLEAHVKARMGAADAARVADFLGELVDAAFDDEGRLPLRAARHDAAAMTDQVCRAFEDILGAWCSGEPLLIVLEDLHWADAASVKLLDRALRKLDAAKLFVLALARPEVHERFPTLFAHRDVLEIRLPPLPRRACAKLVHEVMGEDAPAGDVERIVERSEGNAFFLEELIRRAAAHPDRPSAPPLSSRPDLPETVIAVAQARLERLEPLVRRVLRAASVFGDVFWLEGVSALVGEDAAALEATIGALVEQEAIVPSEQPRLSGVRELGFRHILLRDTVYATLTEEDRALGHRLAAQWLEQIQEEGEVVARHWLEGGDRAQAAASFARAAQAWRCRAQPDAAARCAVRALLVAEPTASMAGEIVERVRLLASALEATRAIDVRDVVAGFERYMPPFDPRVPGAVVHATVGRSLEALRASADARALPAVLSHAACALGALSDFAGAKRLLAEATALAADDELRLRHVRYASAKVAFWASDGGTAVELLVDTVLPEEPGARIEILLMLAWAVVMVDGRSALARGLDFVSRAEALALVETGDPLGSPLADPVARVHCAKVRVFCFYHAGEYERGAEAAEEAVELAQRTGLRYEECAQLHNCGDQYLRLGYAARARAALVASKAIARDIGADRSHKHTEVLLAYLDGRPGRIEDLAEGARSGGDPWLELHARYWLGHLLGVARAGDSRPALLRAFELACELKVRTMADDCMLALGKLGGPAGAADADD